MTRIPPLLVVIAIAGMLPLVGCSSDPSTPATALCESTSLAGNNFGSFTAGGTPPAPPSSDLYHTAEVVVLSPHSALEVSTTAHIGRISPQGINTYVMIPVTNRGNERLGLIHFRALRYLDSTGSLIEEDSGFFVNGSAGDLGFGYSNTSLAPGETALARTIEEELFNRIATIEISGVDEAVVDAPPDRVIPVSAARSGATLSAGLQSCGANQVDQGLHSYYLLGAGGVPLVFGYFSNSRDTVAPGATWTVTDQVRYSGAYETVEVRTDYDLLSTAMRILPSANQASREQLQRKQLSLWRAEASHR